MKVKFSWRTFNFSFFEQLFALAYYYKHIGKKNLHLLLVEPLKFVIVTTKYEPPHEKTNNLLKGKQRRRSASR